MSHPDEETFEHTLLIVREVSVYKIPPRSSSGGYKCSEWLQSDKIWTGRLKVTSLKEMCEVRLEDTNSGELFAACPVLPGRRDTTVENVSDSSRYFVLRIDDGIGKHAFIGLGFTERNEAFDFNVALSDYDKYVQREAEKSRGALNDHCNSLSSLDLRLKEGETMRINVKTKPGSGAGMLSSAIGVNNMTKITGCMHSQTVPHPRSGQTCSPLPPPPNDTRNIRLGAISDSTAMSSASNMRSARGSDRAWIAECRSTDSSGRINQPKDVLLPATKTGPSKNCSSAGGWAAF